jgi:hypothetical protein
MIKGYHGIMRVFADIMLLIPMACIGFFVYWWVENHFTKATDVSSITTDKDTYHAGDIVHVTMIVHRYKTCKIELTRVVERPSDRREYVAQLVEQQIIADDPVIDREWSYMFQVPPELRTGDYILFSRVRYLCNGLDYVWPRVVVTPSVLLHIIGHG